MEGAVLVGVRARNAVDDDEGAHQLIGNMGNVGVDRRQGQAKHQHQDVDY